MKLKIKKRPTCMYVHIYIYIGRKLQGISFNFFKKKNLQKKKKKKNFSDVALFAMSENSDVSLFKRQKSFFFFFFFSLLFSSLLDIWLKILFNFLIKSFKI
jgi:hypothetical protein